MADIGEALLAWIKLPGVISDEDAYSFRDIEDFDQIVKSFESLFGVRINADNDSMKLRQIRSIAKVPSQFEKFVQEIDFDKVLECDHIELENFVQYLFYAKYEQNQHELKDQISQLKDVYSEELNKLLEDNTGPSKNEQIIIATKVRGLAKILQENVNFQIQIDKLKNDLELITNDSGSTKTNEEAEYLQQIEKLRISIERSREEVDRIKEDVQNQKMEINEIEKKKGFDYDSKIESKQLEIKAATDKINAINDKLKTIPEIEEKISRYEEEENAKRKEIKEKEDFIEQIQSQIDSLKQKRNEEIAKMKETNLARLDQKKFLEEQAAKQRAEISRKKELMENISNDDEVLSLSQKFSELNRQLCVKKEETSNIVNVISSKYNID